jgi:copper chaperone CopZ
MCSALVLFAAGACEQSKSEDSKPAADETVSAVSATVAASKPTSGADEASCAGADGKADGEHSGADCMKKSADMADDGEGMGCNKWDDAADEVAKRDVPVDADWNVLAVTGMTCGGCERRIIANVGELDGVVSVEADAELGKVRVAIAKGNATAGDAAKAKILELGYKVQ